MHEGIESLTRPEPSRPPQPKPRPRCESTAYYGQSLRCEKDDGHDDPMAEIGGRRTDPIHSVSHASNTSNKLIVTYTWVNPPTTTGGFHG